MQPCDKYLYHIHNDLKSLFHRVVDDLKWSRYIILTEVIGKLENKYFLKIRGNFFVTLQDGADIKGVVTRRRVKESQKVKCWFTWLTNAVVGEYNCIRISPHLGINKETKWHHPHCKQCGASCHADAAKKLVKVIVCLMIECTSFIILLWFNSFWNDGQEILLAMVNLLIYQVRKKS